MRVPWPIFKKKFVATEIISQENQCFFSENFMLSNVFPTIFYRFRASIWVIIGVIFQILNISIPLLPFFSEIAECFYRPNFIRV
jgi:hypothetical protein